MAKISKANFKQSTRKPAAKSASGNSSAGAIFFAFIVAVLLLGAMIHFSPAPKIVATAISDNDTNEDDAIEIDDKIDIKKPRVASGDIPPFEFSVPRTSTGFFQPAFNQFGDPEKKSRKVLFPQGSLFLYAGYSGSVGRDIQNGFSVGGPFYGTEQEKAMAGNPDAPMFMHVGYRNKSNLTGLDIVSKMKPEEIAEIVREQIERFDKIGDNVAIWGIVPEEVRPWKGGEFNFLKIVYETVKKYDKKNRPVYMYHPCHRTAKDFTKMGQFSDYIGKGTYVNESGFINHRAWVIWSVQECLRGVGNNPEKPVLVQPWLAKDPQPEQDALIPFWVRHDVYAGLIAGARGVVIWSLFKRKEVKRTWKTYYENYAQCGKELTQTENRLGDVFLFGDQRSDLKVAPVEKREDYIVKSKPMPQWLSAEYAFANMRLLFITNSFNETTTFKISGLPKNSRAYDAFTNEHFTDDQAFEKKLAPWEIFGIRIIGLP